MDVAPEEDDVYEEFDHIRQKNGIKRWAAKFVPRKYAFGEVGITEGEAQWMKVVYGYNGTSILHIVCYLLGVLTLNRDWRRTCTTTGLVGSDIRPGFGHKHIRIRAVCIEAENYGTVLD